jgi:hypothetical protein
MHWRISIAASAALLISAAISIARASLSTSTIENPASDSLGLANGRSVATGAPSRTVSDAADEVADCRVYRSWAVPKHRTPSLGRRSSGNGQQSRRGRSVAGRVRDPD